MQKRWQADCESENQEIYREIVSSIYAMEEATSLMKSQKYGCLSKTCTMLAPADMPMWMMEIS